MPVDRTASGAAGAAFALASDARQWWRSWRVHHASNLPWRRARTHYHLARRRAFANWPVHGNVLEMLRDGRLEIGDGVLLSPHVLLTAAAPGRITIGPGTFLNVGVQVAAIDCVEIGPNCLFAHGCFIADHDHRFDDLSVRVMEQGMTSRGPVRIGENVWCGANVVVTSGVTIGDRCVVGANSVVTRDLPSCSIAIGAPAKVIATVARTAPPTHPSGRFRRDPIADRSP